MCLQVELKKPDDFFFFFFPREAANVFQPTNILISIVGFLLLQRREVRTTSIRQFAGCLQTRSWSNRTAS